MSFNAHYHICILFISLNQKENRDEKTVLLIYFAGGAFGGQL